MVPNLGPALAFTFREEGGFANDPRDSGGATNMGITRATLSKWLQRSASVDDVKNLTKDTATAIYKAWYWKTISGDALPSGVDLMVFDMGVNSGDHEACVELQATIGISDATGHIDQETLDVLASRDPKYVVQALAVAQEARYRSLKNFPIFGETWIARLGRRVAAAQAILPAA